MPAPDRAPTAPGGHAHAYSGAVAGVARRVGDAIAGHPRHGLLFAFVAGLLAAPTGDVVTVVAAVATAAVVGAAVHGRRSATDPVHVPGPEAVVAPGRRRTASRGGVASAPAAGGVRSTIPVRPGFAALAAATAVVAGGVVAAHRLAAMEDGVLPRLAGRSLAGRVVILEPVREHAFGTATARARLIGGPASGEQVVLRMRRSSVTGAAPPDTWSRWPEVGEIVGVRGGVAPLGRYDAYQRRRGAAMALEVDRLVRTGARRGGPLGALDAVRRRAEAGLDRGLPPAAAALARGMVLGEDERLDENERTDFQRSGLAHILAVSGQNVMLLATLVLGVGALFGVPLRARLIAALALIALYVPLTGAGPSIQRAGVMGVAGLVAALSGRLTSRWYALGLAAAVTLALNPLTSGEPGWQLSFAAVVALLALGPPLREALGRRMPAPVAEAAAITIAATIGTAPLMAFQFGRVSLVSLPANLVAAPAVAPVMWLGMLATAAAQLGPALAVPFDVLAAPPLAFIAAVAHAASGVSWGVASVHLGSPAALVAAYAGLAAAAIAVPRLWRAMAGGWVYDVAAGGPLDAVAGGRFDVEAGRPFDAIAGGRFDAARLGLAPRRRRFLIIAAALAVAAFGIVHVRAGPAPPARGELVVSFLDIGQGDATLLQRNGESILVDTGPPDGPILDRVADAGVRRLDVLVLTPAQSDQEGAALPVVQRFRPRLVIDGGAGWPTAVQRLLPATEHDAGGRIVAAHAGEALDLGGLRLRLLSPPPPGPDWRPEGDPNERAVVALASASGFDLLLTADAESDVTLPLDLPHVDALKVAHHGSADEGLPLLLDRLTPSVAAIEVGRHNTYGHPAPATIAELRGVPTVVRTDRDGTVRLHVRAGRMWIERLGPGH